MRVLLAVLLIGIAGCGGEVTSPDAVAALKKPGTLIKHDDQGSVVELRGRKVTDAGVPMGNPRPTWIWQRR